MSFCIFLVSKYLLYRSPIVKVHVLSKDVYIYIAS